MERGEIFFYVCLGSTRDAFHCCSFVHFQLTDAADPAPFTSCPPRLGSLPTVWGHCCPSRPPWRKKEPYNRESNCVTRRNVSPGCRLWEKLQPRLKHTVKYTSQKHQQLKATNKKSMNRTILCSIMLFSKIQIFTDYVTRSYFIKIFCFGVKFVLFRKLGRNFFPTDAQMQEQTQSSWYIYWFQLVYLLFCSLSVIKPKPEAARLWDKDITRVSSRRLLSCGSAAGIGCPPSFSCCDQAFPACKQMSLSPWSVRVMLCKCWVLNSCCVYCCPALLGLELIPVCLEVDVHFSFWMTCVAKGSTILFFFCLFEGGVISHSLRNTSN